MKGSHLVLVIVLAFLSTASQAWETQRALDYILAHNPVLRAQRAVVSTYEPEGDTWDQVLEHTSLYGRLGAGGTDYRESTVVAQAGIRILIPLTGTKENRELAQKAMAEVKAIDAMRSEVLKDIAQLREKEADLKAEARKLKFYKGKATWLQKREKNGNEDPGVLWDIGQKVMEQEAEVERVQLLVAFHQDQVSGHAGEHRKELLAYLQGKGTLEE